MRWGAADASLLERRTMPASADEGGAMSDATMGPAGPPMMGTPAPSAATPSGLIAAAPPWIAGGASIAAGAIHAAAVGSHAGQTQVVWAFSILAALQLGWGVLALSKPSRWLSIAGLAVNGAAVGGWVIAKTAGIGFIDGFETAEPAQFADGLAAAMALVAVLGVLAPLLMRRATAFGSLAIALLAVSGMVSTASHTHEGSHHGDEIAAGHDDGHGDAGHDDGTGHDAAALPDPKPYDPSQPVDLSGVEGVTKAQVARAEDLVERTLARLPQFADVTTLEAKGWKSIRDGGTGYEHYINWSLLDDGRQLDPDYPESLVFEIQGGQKRLVSAMFMAEGDVTLDQVPDIGGKLTQWHIHDNLCYSLTDPPVVAGITGDDGVCRPGTRKLGNPRPMIHVWIRSHECGPFAALEGVAGGQVKAGETHFCNTAHGSH